MNLLSKLALDIQIEGSPDFSTPKKNPEIKKHPALAHNAETIFLSEQTGVDNAADACSTDLRIGYACYPRNALHKGTSLFGDCKSSEENVRDLLKPLGGLQFGKAEILPIGGKDKQCQSNLSLTKMSYPLLASPLDFPLDPSHSTRKSSSQVEAAHPTSFGRMYESPKRSRYDTVNDPDHDFLNLSLAGFTEVSQGNKKNKTCDTQSPLALKQPGRLYYEPPKLKDLIVPLTDENLSRDNLIRQQNDHPLCSTPPSLKLTVSANGSSPESVLRNSAMSYTKTPSIIRKKTSRFPEASGHYSCTGTTTPMHLLPSAPDREDTSNLKDKISGCKRSVSGKSLGRRLEYAFDMEWDSSRCCTPVSAAPPGGLTLGANTMLTP